MRVRLKGMARNAFAHALYYLGILHVWQFFRMRRRTVVLMYHRVLTPEERRSTASHPALVVDRDTFAAHMALLKRRFRVLTVDELAHHLETRTPLPSSSCVITFDDGWKDNFSNALPVLQEHGLPALIFLPVNYVGSGRLFWQEALTHLLLRAIDVSHDSRARYNALKVLLASHGLDGVLNFNGPDRRRKVIAIVGQQKKLPRKAIEEMVRQLSGALGVAPGRLSAVDGFIDWDQAQYMAQNGISFGAHGVEHLLLTQVDRDDARREIRDSKCALERQLGPTTATFSYPNGYLTPEIAHMVAAEGYQLGFITKRGFVSCHDDPFTIRRLNVHQNMTASAPMFFARILGLL